ncbi:MAG: hypothetical protein RLZZ244_1819 [Verrucomicrobiota bacterium]|jgi:capsular exopolysaccharide synthesis family protein
MHSAPSRPQPTPPPALPAPEPQGNDLLQLVSTLLEHPRLLLLCALAGFLPALLYLQRQPVLYRASLVLLSESPRPLVRFDSDPATASGDSPIQNALDALQGQPVLLRTLRSLQLESNPTFAPLPRSESETLQALLSHVQTRPRKGSQGIEVRAEHPDAATASSLANALAESFLAEHREEQARSHGSSMQLLLQEADSLKARLQKSEEALQSYLESHNAASLEEKQDTVTSALKTQAANLASARATRIRLETDVEAIAKYQAQPEQLLSVASIAQHPTVASQQSLITDLLSRIATLRLRYTEKHPRLIQTRLQLQEAENAVLRAALQIPDTLQTELERARATERNFAAALKEQERQSLALGRQAISYHVLSRDVETDRSLYQAVLRKMKETDVAAGIHTPSFRVLSAAPIPSAPMPRKAPQILLLGTLAGLFLGAAALAGKNLFQASVRSPEEIEECCGLPVLASLVRQSELRQPLPFDSLLLTPNLPLCEGFRTLRASLHLRARKHGRNCFLFTSPLPGEGKSICSSGYALALAQQGLRTLLIDADLRRPSLEHKILGTQQLPGLADILQNRATLTSASCPTNIPNLFLLPAGDHGPKAFELLSTPRFPALLELARTQFDCIILDCAPVLPVSDAALLGQWVDSVCIVIRYAKTPRHSLLRTLRLLHDAHAPIEGLVLNAVHPRSLPRYDYLCKASRTPPHAQPA